MYYYEVKNFLKNGYPGQFLMSQNISPLINDPHIVRLWVETVDGRITINDFRNSLKDSATRILTNKNELDEFVWIKLSSILING